MAIDYNKLAYHCVEDEINNGVNNVYINKGNLSVIRTLLITNFSSTADITFKLNLITNASRTVEAGKTFRISDEGLIEFVYLSNASGSAVRFSVFMIGA